MNTAICERIAVLSENIRKYVFQRQLENRCRTLFKIHKIYFLVVLRNVLLCRFVIDCE